MLLRFYWFGFAVCDGFCFCLQIDSGIEVCCVNGDVAKPVAYSVDVHATPEKMGCGRAPHRVWAHIFCRQGWHSTHGPSNGSFHQIINAEAGDWVAVPIQEDTLFRSLPLYGSCQFVHGLRPKGAVAELVTLSTYLHPRQVAAGNECEVEVPNEDLGRF